MRIVSVLGFDDTPKRFVGYVHGAAALLVLRFFWSVG